MLNLLLQLVEDLLTETSSWKLLLGETLQVGVAGGSQPHKTTVQNWRRKGEEIQDDFQEIISLSHLFTTKVSKCHLAPQYALPRRG